MNQLPYRPKPSPGGRRRPGGAPSPGTRPFRPPDPALRREPETRRWSCADGRSQPQLPEPDLRFLRCSLSYQNQTLAEIKALLEQLALSPGSLEK